MKHTADDLPKTLGYFVTDTGDAVHAYSGAIDGLEDEGTSSTPCGVDPGAPLAKRCIFTSGTGHALREEREDAPHVGSYMLHGGGLVFHVFDGARVYRTESGRLLTDADIQAFADEAEASHAADELEAAREGDA